MTRFLVLSSIIINPRHVSHISLKPKKYLIKLAHQSIDGAWLLGSGSLSSDRDVLEICEEKSPKDYAAVTEWIYNHPKNPQ